jgi:hypothetical protein
MNDDPEVIDPETEAKTQEWLGRFLKGNYDKSQLADGFPMIDSENQYWRKIRAILGEPSGL